MAGKGGWFDRAQGSRLDRVGMLNRLAKSIIANINPKIITKKNIETESICIARVNNLLTTLKLTNVKPESETC